MLLSPQQNKPISVKEMRQQFPKLMISLEQGNSYVLIHRSKPIARILPYGDISDNQAHALRYWSHPSRKNKLTKKISSVALVRKERT